ncbi:ComF family protein [Tissierella creatinini]|nr:ComF family protein [Tissierella creatinini]TJX66367.1 ComF family protein [Soehngenia saccharolytica]
MGIKNLLFPTKNLCYLCKDRNGVVVDFICNECRERLVFSNKEVDLDTDLIHRTIYCLSYNKYLKEIVHDFKFNDKSYLYKPLAELMFITIKNKEIKDIDLIAYIPIHRKKEAIRGYNQSELLASYIGEVLYLPISRNNLIKYKWTKEQNTLNRSERLKNLKDSFTIRNPNEFINKRILLIDDLITTGSTFKECANLIMEIGAKSVTCLALSSSKS